MQYAYDLQHRLTEIQNAATVSPLVLISQYDYGYDAGVGPEGKAMKGMISSVSEQFRHADQNLYGPYTTNYGYDQLYQLTQAAYPAFDATLNVPWSGQTHQWAYDAIGNRTTYQKKDNATQAVLDLATYAYNLSNKGPQLVGVTHTDGEPAMSFSYDNNGNTATQAVTGGATTTYTWDQDDKMTGFTTSDNSNTAAYTYAYNGDRLQRTLNSTTWKYLYTKEDILKIDQGGPNPVYLTQGPSIDDVLAETVGSTTSYAYKNILSSVLQLAGPTGLVASNYNYDAWGQATNWPTPGTDNNPYGYTGREWDGAGLWYYRYRFYSSGEGRFLKRDFGVAETTYLYVRNKPTTFADSSGQQEESPYDPGSRTGCIHFTVSSGWYVVDRNDWEDPWKFILSNTEDAVAWETSSDAVYTLQCLWKKWYYHWRRYEKEHVTTWVCWGQCHPFPTISTSRGYEHKSETTTDVEPLWINLGLKRFTDAPDPDLECEAHGPSSR